MQKRGAPSRRWRGEDEHLVNTWGLHLGPHVAAGQGAKTRCARKGRAQDCLLYTSPSPRD
eukprot:21668-Alexandrium_andersonii.AAC.1